VILRCFAAARVAAGTGNDTFDLPDGTALSVLLDAACARFGDEFAAVLATSRVWVNGDEPSDGATTALAAGDEVAVLPPVSGG
jgi:molybdopterin synthase sulfur carrier subunit